MHNNLLKLIGVAVAAVFVISCADPAKNNSSQNVINTKVDSLLSLMTLEEKIGQLNQYSLGSEFTGPGNKKGQDSIRYQQLISGQVGSVLNLLGAENTRKMQELVVENSRLGIPLLFAYDVIHGYQTMFPVPLAESASWNLDLMQKTAQAAAAEAAASGLHWTFAPMIDVTVDARWGRVMEGAGEDPFLHAEIAKARIRGFQGEDLAHNKTIAATAKHFAGYGYAESGKDYNSVNINQYILHNHILPPFKAATEVNVASFMNSFNDINAVPATANQYLLQDILRKKWNYDGVVVSDWNSIGELVNHGVSPDLKDAAKKAITAGSEIDMEGTAYIQHLAKLVNDGVIQETLIDDAVRNVLELKFKLGLFDDPYKYSDLERENEIVGNKQHHALAEEIAKESIVLLKNDNELLPLVETKNIAVIGPLAKDKDTPLGNWRAQAVENSAISLFEGLENTLPKTTSLRYAEGVKLSIGPNNFFQEQVINEDDRSGFEEAKQLAKNSDLVIMALGETAYMSGEGRSRAAITLPGLQKELLKEIHAINPNIVLVLMNGRPLDLSWEDENIPAIVEAWHLGQRAGTAIAETLTGKNNPSGKLTMSFPRQVGQVPIYYNHKVTGRPSTAPGQVFYAHHTDVDNSPLYPFGYGLSYSTFEYGEIELSKSSLSEDESITVSVNVKNTSNRDGREVVQLYIQDLVADETPMVKSLKAFQKVMINAGESVKVEFSINPQMLSYYKSNGDLSLEKGDFRVFIGGNSSVEEHKEFKLK
ncbi:glycosyl hydrolase [Marivirga tractuosa]|uniref:beta-glucosidase n=1 Tax=Marivirga tractuosa (strain ATCC 23168 / DSM 4126 / NBRC 15989 / NCIMB 1408 / VKM B-1430 / H-43) TaxID=643867 RepID=E4TKI8_MARTH|nr:beta-glucosidase BglX [Marivirga tractuosa]ADR20168.1 glycoside hydrolase family 3 domain protein [Marivirga tractuosa DSM 4126]BDD15391.1 glycosyl hydrolase [Marivirga tractuosa]